MSSVCFFPTRNSPGERRFLNAEYITGLVLLTVALEIKLHHANPAWCRERTTPKQFLVKKKERTTTY